jgi:hypothetical protein
MDERAEPDGSPDEPDPTRNEETESDSAANGDGTEDSSGALARARTVGAEAVGAVVDAVLDAL